MKTDQEIETEIAALKAIKPRVRKTSVFGDNHHDAIDAQIEVLTRRMSCDKIYNTFDRRTENILEQALNARRWLNGEEESLAKEWEELAK